MGRKEDYKVFKCILPNCTHYIHESLALGMLSICPRCGDEFKLTQKSLLLVKPHCNKHAKTQEQKDVLDIVHSVLDKFGIK